VNRRTLLSAALCAAALPVAAACGNGDDSTSGGSSDESSAAGSSGTRTSAQSSAGAKTSAPASDAFPVTVEHANGTTTIKSAPKKVVALGYNDADNLLALGIVPIAVAKWIYTDKPTGPWAIDRFGSAKPELLNPAEISFEKIAALRPDLIVAVYHELKQSDYTKLSAIAPTVTGAKGINGYQASRDQQVGQIAKAIGKQAEAATLVNAINTSIGRIKDANPKFAGKKYVMVLPSSGGQFYVYSKTDPRMQLALSMGFESIPKLDTAAGKEYYATLSAEEVPMLAGDVMVVFDSPEQKQFASAKLLKQQPISTNGHVLLLNADLTNAFGYNTLLSTPYLLKKLPAMLAAKVA
jgi:iron complex transport system substrate-binding protein